MFKIKIGGKIYEIDPAGPDSMMHQLVAQGAEIIAACNGAGICNTCSFKPVSGGFTEKSETETMMELGEGQRLSCQCMPTGDGEIELTY